MNSDPSGLFFGIIPGLIGPTTLGQLQADWFQGTLEYGSTAKQKAAVLVEDYAFNQELDFDWAMDWSEGDDMYSRSAARSEHWGAVEPSHSESQGPAMAGIGGIVRGGIALGKRLAGSTRNELHHLIPRFLGGSGKADAGLFRLGSQAHSSFHKVLSGRLQSTFGFAGNTKASKVRELMEGMNAAELRKLRRVLYESAKTIENVYPEAAGITRELLKEIRRQRWGRNL